MTYKGRVYAPSQAELEKKQLAREVAIWRNRAALYLKRVLRAESQLALYEGPIGEGFTE